MIFDRVSRYIKYRLWAAQQYPDPDYVYARGGIGDVVRYLKSCASAQRTRQILTKFGANIDPGIASIGPWVTLHAVKKDFSNLTIARNVYVGPEVFLDLTDQITIEESVAISMRTIVLTHVNIGEGYPNKPMTRVVRTRQAPTTFRRNSTVGAGAIILHGVTVGEDAVVGAGVVVKKDVLPRTILRSSAHEPPYTVADRFLRSGS